MTVTKIEKVYLTVMGCKSTCEIEELIRRTPDSIRARIATDTDESCVFVDTLDGIIGDRRSLLVKSSNVSKHMFANSSSGRRVKIVIKR